MWLPFIFQDIRGGRRSGILFPRFGLNDLVRPTRHYSRHFSDLGYYFALNDYVDLLFSGDCFAGRYVSLHGQAQYRSINRFLQGSLSYTHSTQLDQQSNNTGITWSHSQRFDSRTDLNASVTYYTNASLIRRNSLNPYQITSTASSSLNFNKRLSWGTLAIGGTRSQDLSQDNIRQTLPSISLAPRAVRITSAITWSPTFAFNNTQNFHIPAAPLLTPALPGDTTPVHTLQQFSSDRTTTLTVGTPIQFGRWTWSNSFSAVDVFSHARQEFLIPATLAPGDSILRHVVFGETFQTNVDWQTGINLPPLFTGTWKIQPRVAIVNTTGLGT